jgi:hypothetical protein
MRGTVVVFLLCAGARAQDPDPAALLGRIRTRAEENLRKLPDYTCAQTIERLWRDRREAPYKPIDTLRLEVALIDGQERFSWLDSRQFDDKALADIIGGGASGTGSFALHAGSVFRPRVADFTYGGAETFRDRPAYRFDYEVPLERSRYRLRVGNREAVVAFRGSFWVSAESLDLLRLEVHAEDIPADLGLLQASDFVDYHRAQLGHSEFLLPGASELIMVDQYGHETRNRTQYSRCRQYLAESRLVAESTEPAAAEAAAQADALAPKTVLELALESDLEPGAAAVGDAVRAVLDKPLKDGDRIVAPKGAAVLGRVTRILKESRPFAHYVVGLQFHALETGSETIAFSATMGEAGPAAGLMREQRSMNPVFTRNRAPRMNILVAETQRGQGILLWEAKRPRIPRGLRMKWVVDPR